MPRKVLAAALLAALALAPAAFAADPLQMPAPITLARSLDVDTVRDAIVVAAARRKWIAESDNGSAFVVRLNVRRHVLRVSVEYEPRRIRFVYVDSVNLDYEIEDGVAVIHPRANQWVEQLSLEIQREIQLAVFARDRLDIVEPSVGVTPEAPVPAAPAEPPPASSPTAPPLVAPTPPRPAGLAPGGVAHVRAATALRGRPMQDAPGLTPLEAGAAVQLVSSTRNLTGIWWYVNSGTETGWLPESALRP